MSGRKGDQLEVWEAFLEVHARIVERLRQELLRERGLSLAWYEVLMRLAAGPGGRQRMQELANQMLLSKSGLTRMVDRLEAAGFVRREVCPSDRRGTYVAITDQGLTTLRHAAPVHLRGIRRHFLDPLTAAQLKGLGESLGELRNRGRQPLS